jgi:hypothetical protein
MAWIENKVGNGRLVLHCGAASATWNEVVSVQTPDRTDSHVPIPHASLVDMTLDALATCGYKVLEQSHALARGGNQYFGLIGLQAPAGQGGNDAAAEAASGQWVLGLRNSHDKSVICGGIIGRQLFVCDNLAFGGDAAAFKFARKHTANIVRDLPALVMDRIGSMHAAIGAFRERERTWRTFDLQEAERRRSLPEDAILGRIMLDLIETRAVTATAVPHILHEYRRKDLPGGVLGRATLDDADDAWSRPTLFRLSQAITEVDKRSPSLDQTVRRHARMTAVFDAYAALPGDIPPRRNSQGRPLLAEFIDHDAVAAMTNN